jgi:hypothetical protein
MLRILAMVQAVLAMPRQEVRMHGDALAEKYFRYFTRRHPRFLFVGNKVWGVALIPMEGTWQAFLKGKDRQAVRTNVNRATAAGFQVAWCDPLDHLEAILAVNRSAPVRQGRPMAPEYGDPAALKAYFSEGGRVFGAFDAGGRLRAYLHLADGGEVAIIARLLAHADDLDQGVMYLLVIGLVKDLLASQGGGFRWLMYDTLLGGTPGLNYFKERIGFKPYRVRWVWA